MLNPPVTGGKYLMCLQAYSLEWEFMWRKAIHAQSKVNLSTEAKILCMHNARCEEKNNIITVVWNNDILIN